MKLFRRNMLQVMVTGAVCAGVPSLIWAAPQTIAPEYDVIVIGSGFAGLAAAISAAENGAKVAVLEKMQVAGGNSSRSGGMMAIPGSSVQKEQGIEDSRVWHQFLQMRPDALWVPLQKKFTVFVA